MLRVPQIGVHPINLINAVLIAEYFIRYVFKLYRLPNLINI